MFKRVFKKGFWGICVVLWGLCVAQSPARAAITLGSDVGQNVNLASVNGENVTLADVFRVLQQSGKSDLLKRALKSAVIEKLYLQEAARMGLHPGDVSSSEVDAMLKDRVDMVEKQLGQKAAETLHKLLLDPLNNAKVRDDTVRQLLVKKVFEKRRDEAAQVAAPTADEIDRFVQDFGKETVAIRIRRILLPSKSAAASVKKRVRQGASFAEIAKKESQDEQTRAKGGDEGWQTPSEMGPVYSMYLEKLKEGEVSDPIKAQDGKWLAVQLSDRKLARDDMPRLIAMAKEAVRGQKALQSIGEWTKQLTQQAAINILFAPMMFSLEETP